MPLPLNAECWNFFMVAGGSYQKISSLRFLILNDNILMDLLIGCRNFICQCFYYRVKEFIVVLRKFFSVINDMIFMMTLKPCP